ncbi:MAG: ABC transporter permease [Paracoccaceae bacterium]
MAILTLALKSLWNRRLTAVLTVLAIAVSVMLLLGVEKVRTGAKSSFANTIAGTDLIVGARSGATQLLLYSVFRIGNATNNISWASYRRITRHPDVAWALPLSLGDSHRGYRVLGTTAAYFDHYRYGRRQNLAFEAGKPFEDLYDAVLGAEVAKALDYAMDDPLVITHGLGAEGFQKHDDKPFRVVGILEPTGTPLDRTIHISLEGMEAIHVDWQGGTRVPGLTVSAEEARQMNLTPKSVTAILIGLKSRFATFGLQRQINEDRREPLLAILPGVALQEMWDLMGTAEAALSAISIFVVASGLLGMLIMLLAGLGERRREMAILRSVGARPLHIFGLLVAEAALLTLVGAILGLALLYAGLTIAQPWIVAEYGLFLPIEAPSNRDLSLLGAVIGAGFLAGALPAWKACRQSLADGMIVRM